MHPRVAQSLMRHYHVTPTMPSAFPISIYILGFSLSLFDRNDDDKGIPRGSGGSGLHSSHTRYVLFLWIDTRGKGKGLMYLYLNSKMCYICNEWEGIIP